MKKYHFGIASLIISFIAMLTVSTGLGTWVFMTGNNSATADINLDFYKNLFVDDIAENYYYASDLSAANYYNVYVFAQPKVADYVDDDTTPLEAYDKFCDDYQITDETSYDTTSQIPENDRAYYGYWNDASSTNDNTRTGYKVFKSVYKRLSLTQYESLGNLFCGMGDGHIDDNHPDGFTMLPVGLTNSINIASDSGYRSFPKFEHFDTNDSLSNYAYTTSGHDIYLYPVYSSSKDYTEANIPALRVQEKKSSDTNYQCKHFISRTSDNITSLPSSAISYYYELDNMVISSGSGDLGGQDTYFSDNNYRIDADGYSKYTGGWTGNWSTSINLNLSDFSTRLYNVYAYYNQGSSSHTLSKANTKARTYFSSKFNICGDFQTTGVSYNDDLNYYSSLTIFFVKVYDYRLAGEETGSFSYSKGTAAIPFQQNTEIDDESENIFYTTEVILPSKNYTSFGINYGTNMKDSNIVSIDESASGTAYPCYRLDSTAYNKVQYTNPTGNLVYYESNNLKIDTSETALDNPESITRFEVAASGVYRFRIKVTYASGAPSSIKVSAAYLRGVFLEIRTTDPTDKIADTEFIDHSAYDYRCNANYDTSITLDNKIFFKYGDSSLNTISLRTVLASLGSNITLYDHVTGSIMQISNSGFSQDSGATWLDSFLLNKNYVFYVSN